MKKTLLIVAFMFSANSANAFPIQEFCEDKYLADYGYSQVEYCVKKQTKSLEFVEKMNASNGWRDEFFAIYNMCTEKYLEEYGPSQLEYCLKKEVGSWNRMNPYEKMEL